MSDQALKAELDKLREVFRHNHVNNGTDDTCKRCGLDLRNEIHIRIPRSGQTETTSAEPRIE